VLPATSWQPDLSEMFVLMSLILMCLQRVRALFIGTDQPSAPAVRAAWATKLVVAPHSPPLAPIHAPMPRLTH
jgi:hypothetical protein